MSAHTPGPWRWWTSNSVNRLSSDATRKDGDVLRAVRYSDGACGIEGSEADMRLIKTAPDLLRELQELAELAHNSCDVPDSVWAAIAKATGGAL